MLNRGLIIALTSTMFLVAALFFAAPTNSTTRSCVPSTDSLSSSDSLGDPINNASVTKSSQYELVYLGRINVSSWVYGFKGIWSYSGAYSRMSIMVEPSDMARGNYNFTLRLTALQWAISDVHTMSSETPYFMFTVNRDSRGWDYTLPNPLFVETKAPYFTLWFSGNATVSGVWMTFDVWAYLRND